MPINALHGDRRYSRVVISCTALLLGVWFLPGQALAQDITPRCRADSISPAMAEARAEWARRCALARLSPAVGVDTGTPSSNGMGNLVDYYENPLDFFGRDTYTGSAFGYGVNETYASTLYLNGAISQVVETTGFRKWVPARKRPLPLFAIFGNSSDVNTSTQIFPHPSYATCSLYTDRFGVTPASTFYVNGLCPVEIVQLTSTVPVPNLAGDSGSMKFYSLVVPAGATSLSFETSGGTGDVDLFVRFGLSPDLTTYNCRPYVGGNNEVCTFTNPTAGEWHVMLRGFGNYAGVTLKGTVVAPPPNCNICHTSSSGKSPQGGIVPMRELLARELLAPIPARCAATTAE
jgi:hypothetical protein